MGSMRCAGIRNRSVPGVHAQPRTHAFRPTQVSSCRPTPVVHACTGYNRGLPIPPNLRMLTLPASRREVYTGLRRGASSICQSVIHAQDFTFLRSWCMLASNVRPEAENTDECQSPFAPPAPSRTHTSVFPLSFSAPFLCSRSPVLAFTRRRKRMHPLTLSPGPSRQPPPRR